MKDELLRLAQRCVKSDRPDRIVDVEIASLVAIRVVEEGHPLGRCYHDLNGHSVPLPLFTASAAGAQAATDAAQGGADELKGEQKP